MRKLLVMAVMMLSTMAQADDIVYTWNHSTTRTDGTTITGARSYALNVTKAGANVANATSTGTTYTVTGLTSGSYVARIATIEAGRQGPWSEPITTVIEAPPAAPGSLRGVVITVNVTIGTP